MILVSRVTKQHVCEQNASLSGPDVTTVGVSAFSSNQATTLGAQMRGPDSGVIAKQIMMGERESDRDRTVKREGEREGE